MTWPMAVGFALYAFFALTFSLFQVKGDALVYYNLLRRFFGEEPDFAYAYQFGSAIWNAPFFLVGKAFGIVFGFQPEIFHVSFEEISITLATNAGFVLTPYLGWRILGELDLPRGPAVLFLTVFGTRIESRRYAVDLDRVWFWSGPLPSSTRVLLRGVLGTRPEIVRRHRSPDVLY